MSKNCPVHLIVNIKGTRHVQFIFWGKSLLYTGYESCCSDSLAEDTYQAEINGFSGDENQLLYVKAPGPGFTAFHFTFKLLVMLSLIFMYGV